MPRDRTVHSLFRLRTRRLAAGILRGGVYLVGALAILWSIGAVRYAPILPLPESAAMVLAGVYTLAIAAAVCLTWRRRWPTRLAAAGLPPLVILAALWTIRPSNERDWSPDQAVLPWAEIDGDLITVHNIRSCVYASTSDYVVRHRSETFDIRRLQRAWFVLEPLPRVVGGAHVFITYGFDDGRTLAVSVEVRRERGERFDPLRGLYRCFEIIYVLGDETDLIRLRTDHRGHEVYLYPIITSPTRLRAMFLHMLDRCNELRRRPEFYHTVLNNCATTVMRHANRVSSVHVPWTLPVLLPRRADELLYRLGLIPDDAPLEELRRRYQISSHAQRCPPDADFSAWIRSMPPPSP